MTMSKSYFLSLAVVFATLVLRPVDAVAACHICGDQGNQAMAYPNWILANVGKSCSQISLEVAVNVPLGSGQCSAQQQTWASRCCSGQRPAGRAPPTGLPPQNIPSVSYVGPHPVCNICRDGDYPFATSMVINFLYIGEGSCAQYWRYGREGRIAAHMCDPVKFFSYEPCGCGQFNPYFNPNHPLNQQAQQAPSNNGYRPQQRTSYGDEDKDGQSMASQNGRGGNGGRRGLKGESNKEEEEIAVVTVVEV